VSKVTPLKTMYQSFWLSQAGGRISGAEASTKGHTNNTKPRSGVPPANIEHAGGVSGGRKGKGGKRQLAAKSPTSVAAGKKRAREEAEEDSESAHTLQVLRKSALSQHTFSKTCSKYTSESASVVCLAIARCAATHAYWYNCFPGTKILAYWA
jgi:hypothetical protein